MAYEVVLRGGMVADGTGAEPYRADLGVADGRIAAIGDLGSDPAGTEISLEPGTLVMPGLIDAHVHADARLGDRNVQLAMLRQGITTAIVGQDGLAFAPASAATMGYVDRYFAAVNGPAPEAWRNGCSIADLLDSVAGTSTVNAATLVPLANVRLDAIGAAERAVTGGPELAAMVRAVEAGLDQGAVGVSTGLEYVPGGFAGVDELSALCAPAVRVGAPYVSHLRSYAGGVAPGMGEALELHRRTGVRLHLSHYRGRSGPLLDHLDGADATYDSYPHLYGNTILAMKALPAQLQAGGTEATLERLRDPVVRRDLEDGWFPTVEADLAVTILGFIADPDYRWASGLEVAEAAEEQGVSIGTLICDLLVACDLAVNCVVPLVGGNSDDDIRALARDPRHMGCSDGIYLGDHPHPRGWGAFARFLGHHTRELGDWTWGEAALHLSGAAAKRFGLVGRGTVAVGAVADLAVVDPDRVADRATYDKPRRLAVGVDHVFVAGTPVLRDGEPTGALPGRGLRRGSGS